MSKYTELKAKARQEAIEWQQSWAEQDYSYGELEAYQDHFYYLAKRYGLVREFRENAII